MSSTPGGSVSSPPPSSTPVPTPTPPSSSTEPPPSTSTPPSPSTTPPSSSSTPTPTSTPEQSTPSPQPSPTTQANPTPTTTPPQQGSSSPPVGNGSTQNTPSSTPTISSTSTSVLTSVLVTTGANGQVVTTTIQSTIIITPTVSASSGSSSNTGAIVGGVAGGIAGLIAILLIGLFCWRRNRRRRDDFDGNFDPDRVVGHTGHTDLAGAEVTPYSYEPGVAGGMPVHSGPSTGAPSSSGGGSMRQYRDSQALLGSAFEAGAATATSGSHYAPTSSDSASAYPSSIAHSSQQHGAMPVPQPYRPMSGKEREALRQRGEGGLGLASALEEDEVIQHTDGGQIPVPSVPASPPHEVPPSYDSIPR
ncbi:hypothetical protein EDB89DRAFT_921351 [Lactarius sanguifluus]|nr:hypothetical protein EDB89DRAFT_921351 [Lactarius sanguifluus]